MRREVYVHICGGLGNQLFQFATAYAISKRWDAELFLYPAREGRESAHPRRFLLPAFAIDAPVWHGGLAFRLATSRRRAFACGTSLLATLMGITRITERTTFRTDPQTLNPPPRHRVSMFGGWQSPEYFSVFEEDIRRQLRLRDAMSEVGARTMEQIQRSERSVSIHVRRGDYLTACPGEVLQPAYYVAAAKYIAKVVQSPEFYVFSDSIEWARTQLRLPFPAVFMDNSDEANPVEDLQMMSMCRHHIMANSSFSWWGAWLSPWRDGVTVGPDVWVGKASRSVQLFLPTWVTIPAGGQPG